MKKNKIAAILAVLLALSVTACTASTGDGSSSVSVSSSLLSENAGWVDSDLMDSVSADKEVRLQDDFAAAANKEWKLQMGDTYYGTFQDIDSVKLEKMKKAATDESIAGIEAEVLRKYYALSSDWEYRNSQGVEPLRPYIEDIESISSMDELYAYFGDLERNPLALAPISAEVLTNYHTEQYPDINLTIIDIPELSLMDGMGNPHYTDLNSADVLEMYEVVSNRAVYILEKLGYSEKDAQKIVNNCFIWEKKVSLAKDDFDLDDLPEFTKDRDTITGYTGSFPLDEILKGWGYTDEKYLAMSPNYGKKLPKLCKSSNLENIKDFLIVSYVLKSAELLDRQTYDDCDAFARSRSRKALDTGKTDEQKEDELQLNYYISDTPMLGALNKVYVENYFDDSVTGDLQSLTEEVIGGLREVFSQEEWLSDEGKELCIEKLDNIKIHIAYQSFEVLDYSKMNFKSKEEGGTFLDAYFAACRYGVYHSTLLSKKKFDRDYWDPVGSGTSTTMTNAFYNPATNGIYICAGICEPNAYAPDMTYEEKMAGLGCIVGHELTHGFDKTGTQYDKGGMRKTWLPYKDMAAFNDRNDKVASYYATKTPFPGSGLYSGTTVNGEATADMGGIRVVLTLASQKKDFDYDRFFRSYARLWRTNVPLEYEKMILSDVHPLPFFRINVGLQQFDEFYDTYGIQEGDQMYLAPDKRIKVW